MEVNDIILAQSPNQAMIRLRRHIHFMTKRTQF